MSTEETTPLPASPEDQGAPYDAQGTGPVAAQSTENAQAPEGDQAPYAAPNPYTAPNAHAAPNAYAAPNANAAPNPHAPYGAPAPAWGAPQGAYFPNPLVESLRTNSVICLVLGILGLIAFGLFTSIPAWVWGNSILNKAQANGIDESVVANAKIGKILGIVGTAIWAALIVLFLLFLFFTIFAIFAGMAAQPIPY